MGEAKNIYFTCLKFGKSKIKYRKMYSTSAKIVKAGGEKPDEFEQSISQALLDLEMNSDMKSQLRDLHVTAAKETDVGGGKKSVIVFVPVPQLKEYRKIQTRLIRELEKKFSGRHVVFIAQRRILPKPTKKSRNKQKQKRPRNRTLTAVHSAILDDLVFPAEIVGKRIRVKLDGSRIMKISSTRLNRPRWNTKPTPLAPFTRSLRAKTSTSNSPRFWFKSSPAKSEGRRPLGTTKTTAAMNRGGGHQRPSRRRASCENIFR